MTIPSQQGERDLFEKWAETIGFHAFPMKANGRYEAMFLESRWEAWQARAALAPLVLEQKQIDSSVHQTESPAEAMQRPADEDRRRLTALWRFGLSVLPPDAKDFSAWIDVLDAAIDQRISRGY